MPGSVWVSFMSAVMHLDLDAKMGAFASMDPQQGYRPNPVAQLAVQLLPCKKEGNKPPRVDAAEKVDSAGSYSATYTSGAGRHIEIKDAANRLTLIADGRTALLEQSEDGTFIADQEGFDLFPIIFQRAATSAAATGQSPAPPITALSYGPDWYARAGYQRGESA